MSSTDSVRPNRGNSERDPHLHSHVTINPDWLLTDKGLNSPTAATQKPDFSISELVQTDKRLEEVHRQVVKRTIELIEQKRQA